MPKRQQSAASNQPPKTQQPPRFVAFDDDGLVRLTCLTRVEDKDPDACLFAIGYGIMRLVETLTEVVEAAKADAAAGTPKPTKSAAA